MKENLKPGDELTEMLLLADKQQKKLNSIKGVDEKGNIKLGSPTEKNLNNLLDVQDSNVFQNFVENFLKKYANPERFSLFKIKFSDKEEKTKDIKASLKDGTQLPDKFLKESLVTIEELKKMLEKEIKNRQEQEKQEQRKPRFDVNKVNWELLGQIGITKDKLEKNGDLERMLYGYRSNNLYKTQAELATGPQKMEAKLSFIERNGEIKLSQHGVLHKPPFEQKFFDYTFNERQKTNFKITGNAGEVINLPNKFNDNKLEPYFVSVDSKTNEMIGARVASIKIPYKTSGIELSKEQRADLALGKWTKVDGLPPRKDGTPHQYVQMNVERRGLSYLTQEQINRLERALDKRPELTTKEGHKIPTHYLQKRLDDKQREELAQTNKTNVNGMKDKTTGQLFNGELTIREDGKYKVKRFKPIGMGSSQENRNNSTQKNENTQQSRPKTNRNNNHKRTGHSI